jgi:uncharacterized membrane protein YheB (UPF0754 family)
VDSVVFELASRPVTVGTLLIPVFSGVIGMVTNWVALKMMFYPLEWVGWRLPFKVGIGRYKFPIIGWQGVIPSKAAKMGSIAVDTGLAKLGSMYDFYQTFEPEVIAAHVVETSRDEIHTVVDQIIQRQYPELWAAAPPQVRHMVHRRVEHEMPGIVREVLDGIGQNIDRLIDLKLMVIRHLEANPRMANRIFQDVGEKEFRFITRSGLYFGFLLGIGPMLVHLFLTQHGLAVPIGAALVGWLTNWIALRVIFQPLEPVQVGPFRPRTVPETPGRGGRVILGPDCLRGRDPAEHRPTDAGRSGRRSHPATDRGHGRSRAGRRDRDGAATGEGGGAGEVRRHQGCHRRGGHGSDR